MTRGRSVTEKGREVRASEKYLILRDLPLVGEMAWRGDGRIAAMFAPAVEMASKKQTVARELTPGSQGPGED